MSDSKRLPYYAPSGLFKTWSLHDGDKACLPVELAGAVLRCDRSPPPVANGATVISLTSAATQPPKAKEPFKLLTDIVTVARRLSDGPAPQSAQPKVAQAPSVAPQKKADHEQKPVFPFDIQDIPAAMDKLGWKKSAELMRQFFGGRLNYSRNKEDESKAINQNGKFYAPEFVDTKRTTWSWLLQDTRVAPALATLIKQGYIDNRQETRPGHSAWASMRGVTIAGVNAKYSTFMGEIDTLAECGGDVFLLHRKFQFQLVKVGMFGYALTDLDGALGNFSIYATVAFATVKRENLKLHTVTVTHIYAYVKVNYSFNDDPAGPSQYLGHWNKQGMIIAPSATLDQLLPKTLGKLMEVNRIDSDPETATPWLDGSGFTVQTTDAYKAENVYYPVRNRDFWNWQMQHQRGGNILSFSDLKLLRLEQPVTLTLA
jgi:hypothetical protein